MAPQLSSEVKAVILRIVEFCKEEKLNNRPIIPLVKVNLRVATATGVSQHTVSNIVKEGKIAAATGTKIGTPGTGKKRKPRKDKIVFSNFDKDLIRDIIYDYFKEHNQMPSISKLLPLVRKQLGFTGSHEILRQSMRQIGFKYVKTDNNKWVWQECAALETENSDLIQVEHDYSKQV